MVSVLGAVVVAAIMWAVAVAAQRDWSPPQILPDVVVARVHREPVTWAQVDERLRAATVMGRPAPDDPAAWRRLVKQSIESIVGDVLTRHTIEAQGMVVSDAMIDAEVAELERQHGGQSGLAQAMQEMQVSIAELRETQRRGLYLQALIDLIVPASEADIDAYLAKAGAHGLSRPEAGARVRAERASEVVPGFLAELRRDPGIWVIDVEVLK